MRLLVGGKVCDPTQTEENYFFQNRFEWLIFTNSSINFGQEFA